MSSVVKLLKKALKRKEKLKDRSKKRWDSRLAQVEAGKKERQEKREENLKKRRRQGGGSSLEASTKEAAAEGGKKASGPPVAKVRGAGPRAVSVGVYAGNGTAWLMVLNLGLSLYGVSCGWGQKQRRAGFEGKRHEHEFLNKAPPGKAAKRA